MKKCWMNLLLVLIFILIYPNLVCAGSWDTSLYQRKPNPYLDNQGNEIRIDFINGSFEEPDMWQDDVAEGMAAFSLQVLLDLRDANPGTHNNGYTNLFHESVVPGWNTVPVDDANIGTFRWDFIEFQRNGIPGYKIQTRGGSGEQYAELNAVVPGRLFQISSTQPGQKVYYEYWHLGYMRGRDIIDFYLYDWDSGNGSPEPATLQQRSISEKNGDWKRNYGSYVVPSGQTETVFAFEAYETELGDDSLGNFLDSIRLFYPSFIEVKKTIITDHTWENGEPYVLDGDNITCVIRIENNGEADSSFTELTDVLPDGLRYIADSVEMVYQDKNGNEEIINPNDIVDRISFDQATDTIKVKVGKIVTGSDYPYAVGTGTIEAGGAVIITFECKIDAGSTFMAGDWFVNQAYVSYNDLGYEEFNVNSQGKLEHDYNVSEVVRVQLLDRVKLQISKLLTEEAESVREFVFRIAYQENSETEINRIFYGTVQIETGLAAGSLEFIDLLPGIYHVSEIAGNWQYEISDPNLKTQTGVLDGIDLLSTTLEFTNKKSGKNWIGDNARVVNRFTDFP